MKKTALSVSTNLSGQWVHDIHKTTTPQDDSVLEHGFLPKSGELYVVRFLDEGFLDAICALQERVYDALPEAEKNFLLPKTPDFFKQHLQDGHPIIGVICGDKVIAQSIIRVPTQHDQKTGMVDMPELDSMDIESITVLQGVLCDPEYRGNKLMQNMVHHWLSWAGQNNRNNAIAEIEVRNHYSWSVFLDHGLWLVSMGHDETDGANLYNVHQDIPPSGKIKYKAIKKLGNEFQNVAHNETFMTCPAGDLHQQKALMDFGYACRGWDKKSKQMAFTKRQP